MYSSWMSWFLLFLAGLCEIVWALALKYCDGFTKWVPALVTVIFTIISFYLLSVATRQIPMGVAYAVWSGIGAIGVFIGNIYLLNERPSIAEWVFVGIIVVGLVGLKFVAGKG